MSEAANKPVRLLSKQGGATVVYRDDIVTKYGTRVKTNEEVAMKYVQQHTDIPVPTVYNSSFDAGEGRIDMTKMDGMPLDEIWDELPDEYKKQVCNQIWDLILKLRFMPKPPEVQQYYQCLADGTASRDVLIKDLDDRNPNPATLPTEEALRQRIAERYYHHNGRRYTMDEILAMLPQHSASVFTHADIAPRNIMVNGADVRISGLLDWESAGWYPEYWEFANMMKPSGDLDWQHWMRSTAPKKWNIEGVTAVRRVLRL